MHCSSDHHQVKGRSARCAGPRARGIQARVPLVDNALFFLPPSFVCCTNPPSASSRTDHVWFLLIAIYLICMWLFHYNSLNPSSRVSRATESALSGPLTAVWETPGTARSGSSCALRPPEEAQSAGASCLFCLPLHRGSVTFMCAQTHASAPQLGACIPPPAQRAPFPSVRAGLTSGGLVMPNETTCVKHRARGILGTRDDSYLLSRSSRSPRHTGNSTHVCCLTELCGPHLFLHGPLQALHLLSLQLPGTSICARAAKASSP